MEYSVSVVGSNVLSVVHRGNCGLEEGQSLIQAMRDAVAPIRQNTPILVYHDASGVDRASEKYGQQIGILGKEWGNDDFIYVAYIPKALIRIVAYIANKVGGTETHICKTKDQAMAKIQELGYSIEGLE